MAAIRDIESDPSDSTAQREIEQVMLRRLAEQHPDWHSQSWKNAAAKLDLSAAWLEAKPDAVWKTRDTILVGECYARIGKLKSGHRRKLALDALKLIALRHQLEPKFKVRLVLVVTEEVATQLACRGWLAEALRMVEIVSVRLTGPEREVLDAA